MPITFSSFKSRLEKIATAVFYQPGVQENLVSRISNTIILFEKYQIVDKKDYFEVYRYGDQVGVLSSLQIATAWCTADRHKAYNLSIEIMRLDNILVHKKEDIVTAGKQLKAEKNSEKRDVLLTKFDESKRAYFDTKLKLDKCIGKAKYIKNKGSTHEFAGIIT